MQIHFLSISGLWVVALSRTEADDEKIFLRQSGFTQQLLANAPQRFQSLQVSNYMIKQVGSNKSSLFLKVILQNTQTLQLN